MGFKFPTVDVCKETMKPIKNTIGKGIDTAILTIPRTINNQIVGVLEHGVNFFVDIINEMLAALELGVFDFLSVINEISLDVKELLILITSVNFTNALGIGRVLVLPYAVKATNAFKAGTGVSIETALLLATIAVMLPIIGNCYMLLKVGAKILL